MRDKRIDNPPPCGSIPDFWFLSFFRQVLVNRQYADKIRALIKSINQTPFKGLGKPEPLKHSLKGFWSGRTRGEHRLVYQVSGIQSFLNYKK